MAWCMRNVHIGWNVMTMSRHQRRQILEQRCRECESLAVSGKRAPNHTRLPRRSMCIARTAATVGRRVARNLSDRASRGSDIRHLKPNSEVPGYKVFINDKRCVEPEMVFVIWRPTSSGLVSEHAREPLSGHQPITIAAALDSTPQGTSIYLRSDPPCMVNLN